MLRRRGRGPGLHLLSTPATGSGGVARTIFSARCRNTGTDFVLTGAKLGVSEAPKLMRSYCPAPPAGQSHTPKRRRRRMYRAALCVSGVSSLLEFKRSPKEGQFAAAGRRLHRA